MHCCYSNPLSDSATCTGSSHSSFDNEHRHYFNSDNDHCHYSSLNNDLHHYSSSSNNEYHCYFYTFSFTWGRFTSPFNAYAKVTPSELGDGNLLGCFEKECYFHKIMIFVVGFPEYVAGVFFC
ncbi:hypothetical protein llap_16190 [Limosa lapponica baueri]|uniref:Uncharacterized protein n=1 Tax=Limosa lapponica baueri TaxID=1758121 RepID=A0A2I0TI91_LIMLA|nr:hypothetical protein llap_16190 [Limosa lapponica baueri]